MASSTTSTSVLPPESGIDNDMSTTTVVAIGLSNPRSGHARQMLDLTNRLQNTGVASEIDLPQITVVGPQSSGKSSLIEAMSGVPFPRARGTCTRCPMECRLSHSAEPWQCTVYLRFSHDQKGQPLGQVTNPQFGEIIYERAEVEERIRRAQHAVLNPDTPLEDFLHGEIVAVGGSQTTFTMNCVCLRISGPEVVDLSFCDLPGLIASVGDGGSDGDIALVQNLVSSYIQKSSCIILLVVACETDFENQGAHRLAKRFDPEGKRTLGVLTKPDRIPRGEEEGWFSFIRNEKEPLKNGWFCVKQPDSEALKAKITWSKARENENNFFASRPWTEKLELEHQKYLGTENLVKKLSAILSDLIAKRLPEIRQEIERKSAQTLEKLSRFPPEPSPDPRNDILKLLHEFTSDLKRHVWGVPNDPDSCFGNGLGLIQAIRVTQEKFRRTIRATVPKFRPFEREGSASKNLGSFNFLGKDTDEFNAQELDLEVTQEVSNYLKLMTVPHSEEIYVDEVLEVASRAVTRELPGHFPFVVQQIFIQNIIEKWEAPAINLCAIVRAMINLHIKTLVKKHFGRFGQGILEDRVWALLQQHIEKLSLDTEDRIKWLCCLEEFPFSLNTHYLSEYQSKFLAHYRAARQSYDKSNLFTTIKSYLSAGSVPISTYNSQPIGVGKVLAALAEINVTGVKPEDLFKLLSPDPMEPALVIMADVRAYFQVAYKRFVDNVPLAIDFGLVRGLQNDILPYLYSHLGINGPNAHQICMELAQEDADMAARRLGLKETLGRLELARRELLQCVSI